MFLQQFALRFVSHWPLAAFEFISLRTNDVSLSRADRAFERRKCGRAKTLEPTNVTALFNWPTQPLTGPEFAWQMMPSAKKSRCAGSRPLVPPLAIANRPMLAAHYWLGMDLGQLARTKSLGALKLVREMEQEFLTARDLDEHLDYAGANRSLGFLTATRPVGLRALAAKRKRATISNAPWNCIPNFPITNSRYWNLWRNGPIGKTSTGNSRKPNASWRKLKTNLPAPRGRRVGQTGTPVFAK